MHSFIKGLAASAAIVALSSVAMAQGQGGASGSTGQATWPDSKSPNPNAQPATPSGAGSAETTGAIPQGGTTDQTPSNSNSGAGSAMQPAPTPGNTPSEEAATGPKQ